MRNAVALLLLVASACSRPPATSDPVAFTCGEDATLAVEIPLRIENVHLAADGRAHAPCGGPHGPDHRESRELDVIARALQSDQPALVSAALRGLGRMGRDPRDLPNAPADGGSGYLGFLGHADPAVRQAAVVALADSLDGVAREPVSRAAMTQAAADALAGADEKARRVADAYRALEGRLGIESDEAVTGVILQTLGRLPYATDAERDVVEAALVARLDVAEPDSPARLGAAMGLEALIRRSARRPVAASTIDRLRQVASAGAGGGAGAASDGESAAQVRRLAMLALTSARDIDEATVTAAAGDPDWQVRRLAVARMNMDTAAHVPLVRAALADTVFQVRLQAVGVAGRSVARTKACGPIAALLDDPEPPVAMAALDQLPDGCQEAEALVPRVERLAASLGPAGTAWHVPARAVVALARIAPDRARPLLETAATHSAWQVRATAADVARVLQDEAVALRLARDEHANVRAAGLRALSRLGSPALFDAAIAGLDAEDYDLIRTSAGFLDGAPDRSTAVAALLARLSTLTDEATDTSRDPRVAILRRLGALMDPADAPTLLAFANDLDPRVGQAAADAIAALSGGSAVVEVAPRGRYPRQPSADLVAEAPRAATLRLDDGVMVELELLPAVAPVTVAQFAERARAGYYDGLTFHRIAPNFVIQGGSPGANEYSGLPRYWRDEPGASNVRGTVGLSTRGRDSADGQIFVNVVDNYRLDHDYTVFARITSGMDAIDRVLEGARIVSVAVR